MVRRITPRRKIPLFANNLGQNNEQQKLKRSMAIFYDDYLTLNLSRLQRMGYFAPDAIINGLVYWNNRAGRRIASVNLETNTRGGEQYAKIKYNHNGEPCENIVPLRWHPSNLKPGTGYYYFVCPITGKSCRKLYLYGGQFVSRYAFRALYPQQAESHSDRGDFLGSPKLWAAYDKFNKLTNQRYRRETYRGRLTPWGRQVNKALTIIDRYRNLFETTAAQ